MINFKQREEMLPSAIILISILILAGTLAYMLIVPTPKSASGAKARAMRRTMHNETLKVTTQRKQALAAIAPLLWHNDPAAVSTAVLAHLTEETNWHGVKMSAFRPQKARALSGIIELPYTVQISGSYAQVHAVVVAIDNPSGKIALGAVQIASSEAAMNSVTATLALSAYIATDPLLSQAPAKGGAHAKA